jgi:hypothetical protein
MLSHSALPQNPIFVVGYPRSGTTLLQALLATQLGFYSFPETHYFYYIVEQSLVFAGKGASVEQEAGTLPGGFTAYLSKLIPSRVAPVYASLLSRLGRIVPQRHVAKEVPENKASQPYLTRGLPENDIIQPASLDQAFELIHQKIDFRFSPEEVAAIRHCAEMNELSSKRFFESIVSHFLNMQGVALDGSADFRWIEKTPLHANVLDQVLACYPRAQVVHILRHPVPAVFSRKLKFTFAQDAPVERLAKEWLLLVQNVERFRDQFPGRIYMLRYEDLVEDFENQVKAVAEFLHFTFDFSRLSLFGDACRTVTLPSETWKRLDQTLRLENTNAAYRDSISPDLAASVEAIVGDKMRHYGYEPFFK